MHKTAAISKLDLPSDHGGVVALGNFDGVHRGHQAVIATTIAHAGVMNLKPQILTFEPHPRTVLRPGTPPFRLTSEIEKIRFLKKFGINDVLVETFDATLMRLTPREFVEAILIRKYNVRHVVAGFDFLFGYKREGDMKQLKELLREHQIDVTEVSPFRSAKSGTSSEIISSSRAREALHAGDVKLVTAILGRPWSVTERVEEGAKRGRQINFPTANFSLGDHIRPRYGVYAVFAAPENSDVIHHGIANFGVRPTVDGKNERLEVHILDFDQDMYGQNWTIQFVDFIRPELAFSDLEALRRKIIRDIERAKQSLAEFVADV